MACPLCFIPPAVAGLWGSAAMLAGAGKVKEDNDACCECSSQASSSSSGFPFRNGAALLGLGGALPLAYLGYRRWPRHPTTAVAALSASSLAVGLCMAQLASKEVLRLPQLTERAALPN
mmetsp:Transcript_96805/g.134334  ORF Transcript_96805/g.134334 Transcript_96805/m.134334 type:complete len:119 (-) Transcript_96805:15-371(-)